MKTFEIVLIGEQTGNLCEVNKVLFDVTNQVKLTKQIAEYLQGCETIVKRHNLKHVLLQITGNNTSVDVTYVSNLLNCSFAVIKALPKLVFSSTAKSFDIHIKTKSECLLAIAAIFNLKRESISYNEFLSAIEAKEQVKKGLLYEQKQAVKNEVLSANEQAFLIHVKNLKKEVKAANDTLKSLSSNEIKAKVEQFYLTQN